MALTLHSAFAEDKSLVSRVGPTYSITRATDGTYRDNTGTIQTAGSGVARFDHNASGTSLGLLVEEARTNVCLQSEDILTTWGGSNYNTTAGTVSNQTTAPDGSTTADKLLDDASTGTGPVSIAQIVTVSTSTAYTFSFFAKADQLDWVYMELDNFTTPASNTRAWFDLTNGVVGTKNAGFSSSGIESYGDGWYRCYATFTTDGTDTGGTIRIHVSDGDSPTTDVALDGTSSIFVWGAVLEAGSFPSSYIATTTASVTRNADQVSTTDMGWWSEPGSYYIAEQVAQLTGNWRPMTLNAGANRTLDMLHNGSGAPRILSNQGMSIVGTASTLTANTVDRWAGSYLEDDFILYVNGAAQGTDTDSTATTTPLSLTLGYLGTGNSNYLNGHISEIRYYDERLDNATLQLMSTGAFPGGLSFVRDITRDLVRDLVSDLVK